MADIRSESPADIGGIRIEDRAQLSALPSRTMQSSPAISRASVVPFESLQHPLSVYQALLENAA